VTRAGRLASDDWQEKRDTSLLHGIQIDSEYVQYFNNVLSLLFLYYFNNIGLQVSPTYKSQRRRFSSIKRYVSSNMILMDLIFFFKFCIMRKLGQCGKYIRSLAIPL
jgi:hypothetical protein